MAKDQKDDSAVAESNAAVTTADGEKPKKRVRRTRKKQVPEQEALILPELAATGMSEAWQAFYRAVAAEMKK